MPEQMSYPEPERNRLLRRIDWRFLLADPQPQKVVSFAGGSMGEALRLVGAEVVERQHCPRDLRGPGDSARDDDAGFDLAVVTNPSTAQLQAAWQALRPGGALYGEWRRLGATRARVTEELEQAGFTSPACYWPTGAPARSAAGAWLPLAAPGALRYYTKSRSAVKGRVRQARRQAEGLALQVLAGMGVATPLCAVAYKPPAERRTSRRSAWAGPRVAAGGAAPAASHRRAAQYQ